MAYKLLKLLFNSLIAKLSPEDKEKAETMFKELIQVIVEGAAKGAVEGMKK